MELNDIYLEFYMAKQSINLKTKDLLKTPNELIENYFSKTSKIETIDFGGKSFSKLEMNKEELELILNFLEMANRRNQGFFVIARKKDLHQVHPRSRL